MAAIFDLNAAREVVAGHSAYLRMYARSAVPWLVLDDFDSYEQVALDYLAEHCGPLEGIQAGFQAITADAAEALTRLKLSYCFLTDLDALDGQAAAVFGRRDGPSRPVRGFVLQQPLTEFSAYALTGAGRNRPDDGFCDSPLSIAVPSITAGVVRGLARHVHELYLDIRREPLSPEAASCLARHRGYRLSLRLYQPLTPEVEEALHSNAKKRVAVRRGANTTRVELADPGWECE